MKIDGLSTLKYQTIRSELYTGFTYFLFDFTERQEK